MSGAYEKKIRKKIVKMQKRVRKDVDRSESHFKLAMRRFRTNKAGVFGLGMITFLMVIALLATPVTFSIGVRTDTPIILSWDGLIVYNPQDSWDVRIAVSQDNLSSRYIPATQPPGIYSGWDRFCDLKSGRCTGEITVTHILGTNIRGQDLLSRMLLGARLSLLVAFGAIIISLIVGIPAGLIAGFYGGRADEIIMRITDMFLTLPFYLIVLLAVTVFLGNAEIENLLDRLKLSSDFIITAEIIGFGFFGWMGIARLLRAEIFQVKAMDYVEAAHALGASSNRIMIRHILPNVLASLIIVVTFGMAINIIAEAAVAFILLGGSGTPSWGQEITEGLDYLLQAWWPVFFPGAAITFAVVAFNLLGDSLRDAFDPRLR